MPVNTAITLRKGSATQWNSTNPILASGEPGYDLTNNILKIGDGVSTWNSLSNHKHTSSDITNFNSSVSGLLPVTNILGGSNIAVSKSGTDFTVAVTGSLGLTTEEVDDRVAALLVAGTGISLNYNDNANTLTIATSGLTVADISAAASLPTTGLTITKTGDWAAQSPSQFFTLAPPQAIQFNNTYTRYSGKWITGWGYSESSYSTTGGSRISALSFDDLQGLTSTFSPNSMAALTTLSLPVLSYVGGTFNPSAMPALNTLSLPALSFVGVSFSPNAMPALTTLSLPVLSYVGSIFSPNTMAALTTLSLPVLSYVGSTFNPNNMAALNTLSLPALSFVGGSFSPSNMAALTTLSLPVLSFVGGFFSPNAMAALNTLSLPVLSYVGGTFNPSNMAALTTLSLPALSYVGGSFSPSNMAALTTLSLPALSFVGVSFSPSNMAALANVTLPTSGTLKNILGDVTMTGMALTVASVDNILQALALLDGTNGTVNYGTGRSVNISGGTSAAPTNLGLTTAAGSNFVCSGTTCTVNWTNHGYATGNVLRISGITTATNANRYAVITVVNANQFTYTISAQSATGAGTATVIRAGASASALVTRGVTLTTN